MMDIHTHTPSLGAIYNLSLEEIRKNPPYLNERQRLSVGLHPWYLTEDWKKDFLQVKIWANQPQVFAIGETGLDGLVDSTYQVEAFEAHILLSEELKKPLIIHCVKQLDELLAIRKKYSSKQPWIFHGFRGKPQQAVSLIKAGFYLSFGEHFNPLSVLACPADRLCIETDESKLSIHEIERRIRQVRQSAQESFSKDLFLP